MFQTRIQVLTHIAKRLKDLHAVSFVHRDIKPGNIMWFPRLKRWTLIDFGSAAETNSMAANTFSLYYAAPEVVRCYQSGQRLILVTEGLDAWSLGVLCIELLSGTPAFDHTVPQSKVRLHANSASKL